MTAPAAELGSVLDRLPEGVLLVEAGGRIHAANPAATRLLGSPAAELVGDSLATRVVDDGDLLRFLRLCAASGDEIPGTVRLRSAHGEPLRCAGAAVHPARDGQPAMVYVRVFPQDNNQQRFRLLSTRIDELGRQVEQRLHAEQLLDGQRQILELIAAEAPLGEILLALTQLIERRSRKRVRASVLLLDRDAGTLHHGAAPSLPDHYSQAIDGLAIGPSVGACGTAAHDGRMVVSRDIAQDPKWEPFVDLARSAGIAACISTPILGSGGAVLGTFALYYDTPRAADEDDEGDVKTVGLLTRTAAIALERDASAREIERLLRRERSARAEAEEANRAKDEFLAMVSHELRNPLNAIVGWGNVLNSEDADEATMRTGLEAIHRNSTLQARLIDEILDYSRIKAGKLSIELAPADIAELTRLTVESARPDAKAAEVKLTCDIDLEEDLEIHCDHRRIQQVLGNLISNALKFTPAGGNVTVQLARAGDEVVITVVDSGCGIEAEFLPHVFERFRQEDNSNRRRHDGLGIGLAIVKSVVEMHRGRVRALSEGRGRGACFEVRLPLASGRRPTTEVDREGPPDLTGIHVLAADDAADARSLIETLFTRAGATVRVEANGADALSAIEARCPDIFLCDIGMPGMDGDEVLVRLRQREREAGRARLPAIAITAYARDRDRRRALKSGFDAHMAKPIDAHQLLWLVRELTRDPSPAA